MLEKYQEIAVIELSRVRFGLKSCVISKLNERAARVRFEITSMISDKKCTTRSSITTLLHPFQNHTVFSLFLPILEFIYPLRLVLPQLTRKKKKRVENRNLAVKNCNSPPPPPLSRLSRKTYIFPLYFSAT